MSAENPRLHAPDADDLVAAIEEAMTTQSAGAWRSGSGTVLGGAVRLFGRLGQIIINRMNAIPEQHFRAFLNEAEIGALPPRPAHTEVTFLPAADGPAEIVAPAGTQVATRPAGDQPAIIFETDRKITVTPTTLVKCVAVDPINAGDHTDVATGAQDAIYPAFAGDRERDRILYIGESVPEDADAEPLLARPAAVDAQHTKLSLIFEQSPPAASETHTPAPAADDRWAMRWLYWDGAAWADLRAAGALVELTGRAPEHLAYLDELAAREAGRMPEPPRQTLVTRLAAFGASLRLRLRSWYEELVFGGMVLASAAAAWHSLKRLRVPSGSQRCTSISLLPRKPGSFAVATTVPRTSHKIMHLA